MWAKYSKSKITVFFRKKTNTNFLLFVAQKKIYKDQMEFMLQNHVFPLFRSELGYMRARVSGDHQHPDLCSNFTDKHGFNYSSLIFIVPFPSQACWVLHYFCEVKFKSDQNLQTALELTRLCLINDNEMPVKVEAAIALQVLISNQEKGEQTPSPYSLFTVNTFLNDECNWTVSNVCFFCFFFVL